jgi:hypothetical protein
VRSTLELLFDKLADERNAGGTANEHGFVDLLWCEAGVFHRLANRADGAVDHRSDELFVLFTCDHALVALVAGEFDVERGLLVGRERDLGFNDGLADGLHRFATAAHIETEVALDVVEGDGDEQVVDVVAAEVSVAVGGDDLEDTLM